MWTLVFTKTFFVQFISLPKDKQPFVLDSVRYLMDVLDLDSEPKYDIIDEYENDGAENQPFPITHHIDYDKNRVYFIKIEESYMQHAD